MAAGAEGATAPETLRLQDRASDDALESGVCLIELAPTDGGNRRNGGKSLRSRDRGGLCGSSAAMRGAPVRAVPVQETRGAR